MVELRWVIFLALWTLFIGPILDFAPRSSANRAPAKPATPLKSTPR